MLKIVIAIVLIINFTSANDSKSGFKKGLYISFWAAGSKKKRKKLFNLIDNSDINTVVIDIKNEYGYISYKGNVKEAQEIGAYNKRTIRDFNELMQELKKRNLYVIGRIVVFKDELFATKNKECAIYNDKNSLWRSGDNLAWSSPFCKKAHTYNIKIAKDAVLNGFDEINFDYTRFPASKNIVFEQENNSTTRVRAISAFLQEANKTLKPLHVKISVDTYGYACWNKKDTGIGQNLKEMSKYVDFISPMLYPSGFHMGIPGYKNPMESMYETIYLSLEMASRKIGVKSNVFRPWLQAFRDYSFDKRKFGNYEIMLQTKAAEDFNANGWLLWNPASYFLSDWLGVKEDTKVALTQQQTSTKIE
jgi:hypothetical protein